MNKKLLIVLMMIVLSLTACQSKVPDGISKEFHGEMKNILIQLAKDVQSNKDIGLNIYERSDYKKLREMSNSSQYADKEMYVLDFTITLYDYLGLHYDGVADFEDDIYYIGDKICELMDIKFDVSKLIK